jgi:hypothetical protein
MDNPEKRATWGTQDEGAIKNGQSRETGNIGYTRYKTKTNKTKHRETGNIGYTRYKTRTNKTKQNYNTI